jgi:hypothetical protein
MPNLAATAGGGWVSGQAKEAKRGLTEGGEESAHDEEKDGVAMVSARGEVELARDVRRQRHGRLGWAISSQEPTAAT